MPILASRSIFTRRRYQMRNGSLPVWLSVDCSKMKFLSTFGGCMKKEIKSLSY